MTRITTRPGQYFTVFGALLAIAGGFVSWYEATVLWGSRTIPYISANGWQEPYAGLSIMAIGLCVTAGLVALVELLFRNARGQNAVPIVGLVPIGLGVTAFGLVVAKYLAAPEYASVGFLVSGCGAAFVALGGLLSLAASLVPQPD
jgi:hypothetical protein